MQEKLANLFVRFSHLCNDTKIDNFVWKLGRMKIRMLQVQKQFQPICAMLNKSIYCCCMVSAWTYFLLASLLFPPWILENIFNILYIMQVLAKSLGILWCTKNERIVKNQHKNPNAKAHLSLYRCLLLPLLSNPLDSQKTKLLKTKTADFHQNI